MNTVNHLKKKKNVYPKDIWKRKKKKRPLNIFCENIIHV